MRVVAALGGNALLKRGEPMTADNQRANARLAAAALAEIARAGHRLAVSHGNGPQVGLLALQGLAYKPEEAYPLDLLNAETEGMIGYLIEQELRNALPEAPMLATLLTQVEVDPADPAFRKPTKPIGPVYEKAEAERLAKQQGWSIAADGDKWRIGVPP
jgi:carbamate kinase